MTTEPKHPVRTFRIFALALLSCLALMGVSASGATALSFSTTGEFPTSFTVSGESLAIVEYGATYECSGETTGAGSINHDAGGTVEFAFHGCSFYGGPCTSDGAESGTIVTSLLKMDLVELANEEGLGLLLDPIATDTFAEFNCGPGEFKWSGDLIGKITEPGTYEESSGLGLAVASKKVTETAGGRKTQLVSSINGSEAKGMDVIFASWYTYDEGVKVTILGEEGTPLGLHLVLQGGEFPAAFTSGGIPIGNEAIVLQTPQLYVICVKGTESPSLSGSGEYGDPVSGEVEFTLHNCTGPLGVNCKSPGQENGTIKTKTLPLRLTSLSDGSPGFALGGSDTAMEFKCSFLANVVVTGGVLGTVDPGIEDTTSGQVYGTHEVEGSEGVEQEYTETEDGEEVALKASVNGGVEDATLDMLWTAGFGQWVELRE